jgi:triphosphatase
VPPPQRAALRAAVATPQVQRTRLQAVYLDTADQRLAGAGLALRLRQEGRLWVQTLKGRGDGLVQRLEHEVPLPTVRGVPNVDVALHAGTSAGAALVAALQGVKGGAAALQPVYRTNVMRWHRVVRSGGAVVELAYDRGHLITSYGTGTERRAVVDEIEFELVRGPAAALPALAAKWATRHGLWWDVRTKSERGFRLALQRSAVPATLKPAPAGSNCTAHMAAALAQAMPNAAELADLRAVLAPGLAPHQTALADALRRLHAAWQQAPLDVARPAALQAPWMVAFQDQLSPGSCVRGADFTALALASLAVVLTQ